MSRFKKVELTPERAKASAEQFHQIMSETRKAASSDPTHHFNGYLRALEMPPIGESDTSEESQQTSKKSSNALSEAFLSEEFQKRLRDRIEEQNSRPPYVPKGKTPR